MADNNANEYSTVTLSLDDGTECECAIVRIFPAGDNNYIALLPLECEAASNDEVYLYRYYEDEDGEPGLDNIETEAEFYLASDAFDELVESGEYDEIIEEEENLQ